MARREVRDWNIPQVWGWIALLLLFLFSSFVIPQNQQPSTEAITPMLLMHHLEVQRFSGKSVSVDFQLTDIRAVFEFLEKEAGFLFDIEPGISGDVSYNFGSIPWDEALSRILKDQNLSVDLGFEGIKVHTGKTQALVITDSSRIGRMMFFRQYGLIFFFALGLLLSGVLLVLIKKRRFSSVQGDSVTENRGLSIRKPLMAGQKATDVNQTMLRLLDAEKIFKDPVLTLQSLAASLAVTPHQLSWLINEKYHKSFTRLVNDYRVNEVKNHIAEERNNHRSLLDIAFDCGFNTKASFNRVFKNHTGMTPSEFKKEKESTFRSAARN
ncbi:MAG: helix-turn-helix domain-containing protein [Candidatus Aminicenantes bacterium]|nr:helix-turn-helix domain-containing protein [Candidatus Aminicenantes bacterium]